MARLTHRQSTRHLSCMKHTLSEEGQFVLSFPGAAITYGCYYKRRCSHIWDTPLRNASEECLRLGMLATWDPYLFARAYQVPMKATGKRNALTGRLVGVDCRCEIRVSCGVVNPVNGTHHIPGKHSWLLSRAGPTLLLGPWQDWRRPPWRSCKTPRNFMTWLVSEHGKVLGSRTWVNGWFSAAWLIIWEDMLAVITIEPPVVLPSIQSLVKYLRRMSVRGYIVRTLRQL